MLQGIDVSSYQSANYSTTGLSFVFIKITEGLSYVNPVWVPQREDGRNHGLVTGFYHYPHIANSPIAEADHFLSQINVAKGDLIALDWEWYGQNVTENQARNYKKAWIQHVKSKLPNNKVGLYVDRTNWTTVDTDGYCGDFLWIADYTTAGQPRIKSKWTFHQYSSKPLDRDVCSFGTMAELRSWAGLTTGSSTPSTSPKETDMPLTSTDVATFAHTDGIFKAPSTAASAKTNPYWTFESHVETTTANTSQTVVMVKALTAQVGALTTLLASLTKDGGLTAEQIKAAADEGATAALERLGAALTTPEA